MKFVSKPGFLKIFFAASACSWMPHWACHYYRLETMSSFVVGSRAFSFRDSVVSLFIYSVLIGFSLIAVQAERYRSFVALINGFGHLIIGSLHLSINLSFYVRSIRLSMELCRVSKRSIDRSSIWLSINRCSYFNTN